MRRVRWYLALVAVLVALSAGFYCLQLAVFQRSGDTAFYLLQDIAFLPIQVLLATFVVDGLLARREKRAVMDKMNMVIGAFQAEAGTELLRRLIALDADAKAISAGLIVKGDWSPREFAAAVGLVRRHHPPFQVTAEALEDLKRFLVARRDFLLRLLENPNLLEHDTFTDTLWAVFHLTDELVHRADLRALPEKDVQHLSGDIDRAYKCIVIEWIAYMQHLKRAYPYLFSLAARTNPFDPSARVEVE